MRLALFFKQFRKTKELSQVELASLVGVDPNYIWMIENQRRTPSLKLSLKLGKVFGASPGWIHSMWFNAVREEKGRWREEVYAAMEKEAVASESAGRHHSP